MPLNMAITCLRGSTVKRVFFMVVLLILLRLMWLTLNSTTDNNLESAIEDVPGLPINPDRFQPQECVMASNGSCVPKDPEDSYLGKGLYAHGDSFYLDGRPIKILSGSFHYFRTQPAQWGDRLLKMKAAGLNMVMTYIPWNLHEPVKDQYEFGGRWDIVGFIKQAQKVGLKVIIRPGPYICAEWEFGGLPAWLLRDPTMKVRTSYGPFLSHVEDYFSKLLPILAPLAYKRGGPIIAFQVENEYGSYGSDKEYLQFLKRQYEKYTIEELLFTSDGTKPGEQEHGSVPGVLSTANFQTKPIEHLTELANFQPNKPLMVTEFWSGWFDHHGEKHHVMTPPEFREAVSNILNFGSSINFYMFVGGTNFEFWNGANMNYETGREPYMPTITSYDYDAPISEDGTLTEKYFIVKELIKPYISDLELPDVSNTVNREAYGESQIESWLPYDSLINVAQDSIASRVGSHITRQFPVSMEFLDITNGCGQNGGWLLYRTEVTLEKEEKLIFDGQIHDRAQVFLDGQEVAVIFRADDIPSITLPATGKEVILDILVENLGRANFNHFLPLDGQYRGISASVLMGGEDLVGWNHIPLDFDEEFVSVINQQELWINYVNLQEQATSGQVIKCPAVFKTHLNLDTYPQDTYIDMKGWTKGIVIVNGYNIGRYWRIGPQRTLYVPAPLLAQGRNSILIFELHKPFDSVTFTDQPLLNESW